MKLHHSEIDEILNHLAITHPEYKVKSGEPYFESGRDVYRFSSHHFVSHYRALHQREYADLLVQCMRSRIGQDRLAHGQIASCLGRYAKNHDNILSIGRRISRDVHDNIVRPMWWVWRRN